MNLLVCFHSFPNGTGKAIFQQTITLVLVSKLSPQTSLRLNQTNQVQVGMAKLMSSKLRHQLSPSVVVRPATRVALSVAAVVAPPVVHLSHPPVLALHHRVAGILLLVVTLRVVPMTHRHQLIKGAPPDQKVQIHNNLLQWEM